MTLNIIYSVVSITSLMVNFLHLINLNTQSQNGGSSNNVCAYCLTPKCSSRYISILGISNTSAKQLCYVDKWNSKIKFPIVQM